MLNDASSSVKLVKLTPFDEHIKCLLAEARRAELGRLRMRMSVVKAHEHEVIFLM